MYNHNTGRLLPQNKKYIYTIKPHKIVIQFVNSKEKYSIKFKKKIKNWKFSKTSENKKLNITVKKFHNFVIFCSK